MLQDFLQFFLFLNILKNKIVLYKIILVFDIKPHKMPKKYIFVNNFVKN